MLEVTSNINVVIAAKLEQIQRLKNDPDPILRTVALTVLPEFKKRIHIDGKDSSGGQIGTYSPGYMAVRTGAFKNADRVSRGKSQGKLKNAGRFTERSESKAGELRPRYNRSSDPKVILSLTRQMENDLAVVKSSKGYALGYNNPDNLKKAKWNEATYNKKILTKLTKEERALAKQTAEEFTEQYLKD